MIVYYLFNTLYVFVCLALLLVILLQQGKGGDIASAFGGGSSQTAFGARGGATVLTKITCSSCWAPSCWRFSASGVRDRCSAASRARRPRLRQHRRRLRPRRKRRRPRRHRQMHHRQLHRQHRRLRPHRSSRNSVRSVRL
jgi:protein translocase SecG subunit